MTKVCTKCGKEKDLELFSRDSQGKLKRKARCKECLAEYAKEWAERPGIKARKKEWFDIHAKNNPESRLVYSARERSKKNGTICTLNPEDIVLPEFCPILGVRLEKGTREFHDFAPSLDRIDQKLGYVLGNIAVVSDRANRLKNDATAEEHRKTAQWILFGSKEKVLDTERPEILRKRLLDGGRTRSEKLGLPFDLNLSDILIPERCPILGIPLIPGKGIRNRQNGSPTLDRVNPDLGYVVGNVGIISYRANRIKNNGIAEEHLKIADWMDSVLQCKQLDTTREYEETE